MKCHIKKQKQNKMPCFLLLRWGCKFYCASDNFITSKRGSNVIKLKTSQNWLCKGNGSTKCDFPVVRFVECSLFFSDLVESSFSCPTAAISSLNLQDESTSRPMIQNQGWGRSDVQHKNTIKIVSTL